MKAKRGGSEEVDRGSETYIEDSEFVYNLIKYTLSKVFLAT